MPLLVVTVPGDRCSVVGAGDVVVATRTAVGRAGTRVVLGGIGPSLLVEEEKEEGCTEEDADETFPPKIADSSDDAVMFETEGVSKLRWS